MRIEQVYPHEALRPVLGPHEAFNNVGFLFLVVVRFIYLIVSSSQASVYIRTN